jgi:hypothetical protein
MSLRALQEHEAREAQAELEARMREAEEKEHEARQLQEELEEARRRMEENQRALEEALNAPAKVVYIKEHDHEDNEDDDRKEGSKCPADDSRTLEFRFEVIGLVFEFYISNVGA